MEFLLDVGDSGVTPEKIYNVYYNELYGEFSITFYTAIELVKFGVTYGEFTITPPEDEYDLPILRLI